MSDGPKPASALLSAIDLLLTGGTVVDGTGRPGQAADVALQGDRIVAVGDLGGVTARRVIDASGSTIVPGFIDAHGHSDIAVLSSPRVPSKIHQGITTEVMGNCGLGVAPLGPRADIEQVRSQLAIVDVDPGVEWRWRSVAEYLGHVEDTGVAMNVAMLAGHLAIRASCMGYDDRKATSSELEAMQRLTDEALTDGARGLSTGLMYPPNAYAGTDELVALGEVVAQHDALFTFHMRDYGDRLLESVSEAILVAERSGCRAQLSHLAVAGRRNWGKVTAALELIDAGCGNGLDLAVDCYPYLAGSTNLTQLLPRWTLEGGTLALLQRLADPAVRQQVAEEVEGARLQDWGDIYLAGGELPDAATLVGRSFADIAGARGAAPLDVLLDLAATSRATATIVAFGRSDDDLHAALRHPRSMIGSDGLGLDPDGPSGGGQPHPRSYGCYPKLLGRYVRDEGVLTFEGAVHKSTQRVAGRFGIPDRGVVAQGHIADLVLLDPATITDHASYQDPHRFSTGVLAVVVGGEVVMQDGHQTDALPGVVLGTEARRRNERSEEHRHG
jgi:N-acyl-D-amino-acid deacylase